MAAQEIGRTGGRLDVEAEVVETARQRQHLLLVLVGDREQHRTVVGHLHARSLQRLVERARQLVVVTDRLARRLHLRREAGLRGSSRRRRPAP